MVQIDGFSISRCDPDQHVPFAPTSCPSAPGSPRTAVLQTSSLTWTFVGMSCLAAAKCGRCKKTPRSIIVRRKASFQENFEKNLSVEPWELALTEDAARIARMGNAGIRQNVHKGQDVVRALEKAAERGFHSGTRGAGGQIAQYGKQASKAAPWIAGGAAAYEFATADTNNGRAKAVVSNAAGWGGAMGGAEMGAAVGACAGPIGAALGGIGGGFLGGAAAAAVSDTIIDGTIED